MKIQQKTGQSTEYKVKKLLEFHGLTAKKPIPDNGVDLEVSCISAPEKIIRVQIKGRGCNQKNGRYRWFQIRTTPKQREGAVKSGLSISSSLQKNMTNAGFFLRTLCFK